MKYLNGGYSAGYLIVVGYFLGSMEPSIKIPIIKNLISMCFKIQFYNFSANLTNLAEGAYC